MATFFLSGAFQVIFKKFCVYFLFVSYELNNLLLNYVSLSTFKASCLDAKSTYNFIPAAFLKNIYMSYVLYKF